MRHLIALIEAYQYQMFPPDRLYHTTSPYAAFEILGHGTVQAKDGDSFISFSEKPHLHDIEAHGAVIVFDLRKLYAQLEHVEYTEAWAHSHPEQARYIAGSGWSEQFDYTPEDDEEEDDGYETAYADAELEAFLCKHDEAEWISLQSGFAVHFGRDAVTALILDEIDADTPSELANLGYPHITLIEKE